MSKNSNQPKRFSTVQNSSNRSQKGNMLALIGAFSAGIFILLFVFAMVYLRLIGTDTERKTAIEAAALAAAREMSNIVVPNDDFGLVGLSDSAPNGTDTQAGDNYYTSVHGINSLMGTTLLDFIIAQELGDSELQVLARQDRAKVQAAADQLLAALQASIVSGGSGQDKNGNTVSPYQAAENAYKSNQVRMAGANSSYQAGSLQLSLGAITGGLQTNIETPAGWSGSIPGSATIAGKYKSYVPVTRSSQTWVFAGIGDAVKIVDHKKFVNSVSGLPFQHGTIVRAEAIHNVSADGAIRNLKAVACAQPASVFDPKPNPGALVISFPDGIPDGTCAMRSMFDLYGPCLRDSDDDSDMYYSFNGDYPVDTGSSIVVDSTGWPIPSDFRQTGANSCKIAMYDWLKRAGTKARVDQVVGMHSTNFNDPNPLTVAWPPGGGATVQIPNGVAQIFRFDPNGYVTHQSKVIKPSPYYIVSDRQTLFESFEVLTYGAADTQTIEPINLGPPINDSDGKLILTRKYDLHIRDFGRKPGKQTGGKHAGEPMLDNPFVSSNPKNTADVVLAQNNVNGKVSFDTIYDGSKGAKKKGGSVGNGRGALPLIMPQEDFAFFWNGTAMEVLRSTDPLIYKSYPVGSGLRQTYHTNGIVADIRFRRQVEVADTVVTSTPVIDPTSGAPTIDPTTGLPATTTSTSTTQSGTGYIGLK